MRCSSTSSVDSPARGLADDRELATPLSPEHFTAHRRGESVRGAHAPLRGTRPLR
jgi:hypothetical protein